MIRNPRALPWLALWAAGAVATAYGLDWSPWSVLLIVGVTYAAARYGARPPRQVQAPELDTAARAEAVRHDRPARNRPPRRRRRSRHIRGGRG